MPTHVASSLYVFAVALLVALCMSMPDVIVWWRRRKAMKKARRYKAEQARRMLWNGERG
jgi:hypothetical protein